MEMLLTDECIAFGPEIHSSYPEEASSALSIPFSNDEACGESGNQKSGIAQARPCITIRATCATRVVEEEAW